MSNEGTSHVVDGTPQQRELEQVVKELEFRTTITTAMLSTLDLEQILYVILSGITSGDGLGFNRAFLFLTEEGGRSLRVTMALGPASAEAALQIWDGIRRERITLPELLRRYESYSSDPAAQALAQRMASLRLPLERLESLAVSHEVMMFAGKRSSLVSVMARCLVNNSPFATNSSTLVQEVGGAKGDVLAFRHVAIVPLTVAGRLIGAILADNYYTGHPVGSEDLRSLHAFGNLAALAIDRARLHAQTVAMAEVDGLTGVYNRRYYQQQLEHILQTPRAGEQITSIVIFDLDFFKGCNDEHGHLVGDEVLKDVARLLMENVRQTDRVARYGGEEFVVLLAQTGPETAAQVAEKLRLMVKQAPLAGGQITGLTMSAGVAWSKGGESVEELFRRADRALYQAKHEGRDRVVIWAPELAP